LTSLRKNKPRKKWDDAEYIPSQPINLPETVFCHQNHLLGSAYCFEKSGLSVMWFLCQLTCQHFTPEDNHEGDDERRLECVAVSAEEPELQDGKDREHGGDDCHEDMGADPRAR
jgi:hypothetical protein